MLIDYIKDRYFSKISWARKLAVDNNLALSVMKFERAAAYIELIFSPLAFPLMLPAFGPVVATISATSAIIGGVAASAFYETALHHQRKLAGLPTSRYANFVARQMDQLRPVRELFASRREADKLSQPARAHFNKLADRHEAAMAKGNKSSKNEAVQNIKAYNHALGLLKPSSNMTRASLLSLTMLIVGRDTLLGMKAEERASGVPLPPAAVPLVRAFTLATTGIYIAIESRLALTKATINGQEQVPGFIRKISEWADRIPVLYRVQNAMLRFSLSRLDKYKGTTPELHDEMAELGVTARLENLTEISGYKPKKFLSCIFMARADMQCRKAVIDVPAGPRDIITIPPREPLL